MLFHSRLRTAGEDRKVPRMVVLHGPINAQCFKQSLKGQVKIVNVKKVTQILEAQ
jgi:hypothetical protein